MLSDVVKAVSDDLTARGVAATVELGKDFPARHGKPPRVVFIPTSDTIEAPHRIGGNPRSVATRRARADVRVWGASVSATETLLHETIHSLHRVAVGAVFFAGADWSNQIKTIEHGAEVVFGIEVLIPVVAETLQLAPSDTTAQHQGVTEFPGGDVTACG